jgi:prepilin-type N-terminal cleavage/methylation domain-containing protein
MTIKSHKSHTRARGITLVEILIVISILVILASFAIPSVGSATAKAEMTAAVENVQHSIQAARNTARMNEAEVTLRFGEMNGESNRVITYGTSGKRHGESKNNYRLPDDITLLADRETFTFDGRGIAAEPGRITLVSRVDDSISSTIDVW